ncbi:MAG TPA: hypothetical protein HA262_09595 [Methanosarcina sp.]|jgi:hypothetical protein|nr:hypothetical protein [Methanosarcina sp.]
MRTYKLLTVKIFELDISPEQLLVLESRLDEYELEYMINLKKQLVVLDTTNNVASANGILEELEIPVLDIKNDEWKIVIRKSITGKELSQRITYKK